MLPRWIDEIPGRWAGERPGAVALASARSAHTWRDLETARIEWDARLAERGVRAGDRVVVVAENCPAMPMLAFAIASRRAWIVNLNARLSARELDAMLAHADPRLALFLTGESPDAGAHAERLGAAPLDGGRWGSMAALAHEGSRPEAVSGDPEADVAVLLYTTGTTADPKGVMLTHANLLVIARTSVALRRVTPGDRIYGVLPMSHVYGLSSVTLGTLLAGASVHTQPRFAPAAALEFIRGQRLTVCQGVPAMYARLLKHLEEKGARPEVPTLRFLYAGGSPLVPALKRDVERAFGLRLHNGYGLTEASPTVTQTRPEAPRDDCSVGPAVPGVRLRIVDPAGRDLPDGEVGELWVHGPGVMKGYYKNAAATAAAIRDGWLATGDLARRDADGAIHIEGRAKELIIRSGFNVYPLEVEAALNAHPAVTQSAVVGRRTASDEEVVAFVELAPGAAVDAAALLEFAAKSLAPYKRPAQIILMPSLPASSTGKVLKARLAQLARQAAPAG